MKIGVSQGASDLLSKSGVQAAQLSEKLRSKLDHDKDNTISEDELKQLDFNRDDRVSIFEIKDFELHERALVFPTPSSKAEDVEKPEILPDVTYEGPPIIEVNNPEKIAHPGLVFDSAAQEPPVNLGVDPRNFNYYSYANIVVDDKHPDFAGKDVYQAIVLTNPGDEEIEIDIEGSGYSNGKQQPKLPGMSPEDANQLNNDTRRADFNLQQDMLSGQYQLHRKGVKIPKGGSIVIYTRINAAANERDLRAGYSFKVKTPPDKMPKGLQMRVAVTTTSPGTADQKTEYGTCGLVTHPPANLLAQPDFKKFVPMDEHFKPGTDYTSPQGVLKAVAGWQKMVESARTSLLTTGDPPKSREPKLSQQDLDYLQTLLIDLQSQASRPGVQMQELMPALEKYNQELKVIKRVLEKDRDLKATEAANVTPKDPQYKAKQDALKAAESLISPEISLLNGISVSLGRVNGIKKHSEIHSTITMNLPDDGLERVFALVTNPLNTAGASEPQMVDMKSVTQYPTGEPGKTRPANYQQESLGNYGVRYVMTLNLNNTGARPFDISTLFGSPGEHGRQLSVDENYQDPAGYMKAEQTRFTGQVKISVPGQDPIFVNVVHGKVEKPQLLHGLQLGANEAKQVKIELVVPTNNTGPHLLHVNAKPSP